MRCLRTHYPNRYWANDEILMAWFLTVLSIALAMAIFAFIVYLGGEVCDV